MGGGGNTTSTGTTITKNEPPAYIQPYSVDLANRASELSNRAYTPYTGEQVAPLNSQHTLGLNMIQNRAQNGDPTFNAANEQAKNTLDGKYLGQGAYQNQGLGIGNQYLSNIASQQGQRNALAGADNPYLNNVIANTNADIVRTFQNSTMPQTDASFARSGAFGGSAWQQANAENNRQMTQELLKNESNLRMADYNNQLQLSENLANRNQQADAFNRQAYLSDYGQRQDAAENYAQRQQAAFDAERGRQMGMVAAGQQLSNQPYQNGQQMLGVGDVLRDYQQTQDNQLYQNYLNAQNWPLQNLDILANAIRTSMGGGGTTTQTGTMPSVNRTANMVGGAIGGATLGNSLGGGYGAAAGGALGALAGYL